MASGKALSNKDMNGLRVLNLGIQSGWNVGGFPVANGDTGTARMADLDSLAAWAASRANHTGSQLASTISDFNTAVRLNRPEQLALPTANLDMNTQKIVNVVDPVSAQQVATKNYVDVQLAGLVSGQVLKGTVKVATSVNVNIASPGASLDGVLMVAGDIVLLNAQTTTTEKGPYTWNGAAVAMTRALNWDTNAEAVLGSYWIVGQGTYADQFALMNNDVAIVLGTSVPNFTFITSSTSISRYAANSPAVSAGATWTVTHSLGSTDVLAWVKRVASPYDVVEVEMETFDANTIYVKPDIAMSSGEYRIVVKY